jgi:hypothetical protein
MRQVIQATLVMGVRLTVQNKCSSMGCHYAEDDWQVKVIAETWKEAFDEFWKVHYVETGIYIDGIDFEEIEYIEYEGQKLPVKITEINRYVKDDKNKVVNNPLFDTLTKELHDNEHKISAMLTLARMREVKELEETNKINAEKLAEEKREFERLQKKFGNANE